MPNLVALVLMVSDKKIFKDLNFFKFCCHGNIVFEGIKFFQDILKRTMATTFL